MVNSTTHASGNPDKYPPTTLTHLRDIALKPTNATLGSVSGWPQASCKKLKAVSVPHCSSPRTPVTDEGRINCPSRRSGNTQNSQLFTRSYHNRRLGCVRDLPTIDTAKSFTLSQLITTSLARVCMQWMKSTSLDQYPRFDINSIPSNGQGNGFLCPDLYANPRMQCTQFYAICALSTAFSQQIRRNGRTGCLHGYDYITSNSHSGQHNATSALSRRQQCYFQDLSAKTFRPHHPKNAS